MRFSRRRIFPLRFFDLHSRETPGSGGCARDLAMRAKHSVEILLWRPPPYHKMWAFYANPHLILRKFLLTTFLHGPNVPSLRPRFAFKLGRGKATNSGG